MIRRWRAALRGKGRFAALLVLLFSAAQTLFPYAHFLYQPGPGEQFQPRKFDLAALPDRTVRFFVTPDRPALRTNDSYTGMLSQIRAALAVWDEVPTSALRVEFRGIRQSPAGDPAPFGEILFVELPPGVLGLGGPMTSAGGGRGPIVRSQVFLSNDLAGGATPRPSYSERFFTSLVHEVGHALGLQHTLTGAAMSTEPTRATTRAQPLDLDDIAGLSTLYPADGFASGSGVVEGRVTGANGSGVHMASVIAVGPNGTAISALTEPDGRYRIAGLAAGRYWLAVQPLPPATQDGLGPANIVAPVAADGRAVPAGEDFQGQFHQRTPYRDTPALEVRPGETESSWDFRVADRTSETLHTVTAYSFPGNGAPGVHPAFVPLSEPSPFILLTGRGAVEALTTPRVTVLGGDVNVQPAGVYPYDDRFSQLDINVNRLSRLGSRHLAFQVGSEVYLLPNAFRVTRELAPVLFWAEPDAGDLSGDAWTLRGTEFSRASRVFFDGFEASVTGFDPEHGELKVNAPAAPANHRSIVTVLSDDGQSSAMTLPDGNVMAELDGPPAARFEVSGTPLAAGQDTLVEIRSSEPIFREGASGLGFESAAIRVRQVAVASERSLFAVITTAGDAPAGSYGATLVNGLRVESAENLIDVGTAGSVAEPAPRLLFEGLVNSATGQPVVAPGSFASLYGRGFPGGGAAVTVSFNGIETSGGSVSGNQINLRVPAGLAPGPVRLQVVGPGPSSNPMLATLVGVAPGIFYATDETGAALGAGNPAQPGETIEIVATGLDVVARRASEDAAATAFRIAVLAGNGRLPVQAVLADTPAPGLSVIRFGWPKRPTGPLKIALWVDGRASNEILIPAESP